MRKATIVAALAAVVGFSGAALADGMYSKPAVSYKDAPIVVSGPVWSGFYVGVGVGAGSVVHDLDVDVRGLREGYDDDYDDVVPLGLGGGFGGGGNLLSFDGIGGEGAFGTLQAGYDRQVGDRIVVGAFIDYDFSNVETEIEVFGSRFDIELEDMWSIGLRLGYLVNPNTLLYGLLAYTEASFDAGDLGRLVDIDDFSGYSVGAGLETHLRDGWFLKGEYRFTQLDSEELFDIGFIDADLEPSIHTARIVLTYKLGHHGHHSPMK
jgi:outer membrane immunogenic protein